MKQSRTSMFDRTTGTGTQPLSRNLFVFHVPVDALSMYYVVRHMIAKYTKKQQRGHNLYTQAMQVLHTQCSIVNGATIGCKSCDKVPQEGSIDASMLRKKVCLLTLRINDCFYSR